MILLISRGVSRVDVFRLAAIALSMAFLIACGTSGTSVSLESGSTTPLHSASANDKSEVVALLLDGGADIEARDGDGWTPLHIAVEKNKPEVVTLLLDRGANIEARTEHEATSLHFAAAKNESEAVALLLDRGANIEARTENGNTPLHYAAANNESEVVALLLDRGADIETRNYDGPLQVFWEGLFLKTLSAVLSVSLDLTMFLVFGGETDEDTLAYLSEYPDVIFRTGGITPLHLAAGHNKPEVVALLLERGADIHSRSALGSTPLHYAAARGTPEVVELLLDKGADIEILDNSKLTPFGYAEENEHLKGASVFERLKITEE